MTGNDIYFPGQIANWAIQQKLRTISTQSKKSPSERRRKALDSKLNLSAKQLENRIILKDVHTVDVDNLDPKIEQLLSKGLNFIPSSKPSSDNQILQHWDQFEKDVHRKTYFALNPAPPSKSYNPKAKVASDWHPPKNIPCCC